MKNDTLPPGWGSSNQPNGWNNSNGDRPSNWVEKSNDATETSTNIPQNSANLSEQDKPSISINSSSVNMFSKPSVVENSSAPEEGEDVYVSSELNKLDCINNSEHLLKNEIKNTRFKPITIIVTALLCAVIVLLIIIINLLLNLKNNNTKNDFPDSIESGIILSTEYSEPPSTNGITATEISKTRPSSISSETVNTEMSTTATVTTLNAADYVGYWHPGNNAEHELTIHSMNSATVTFSLWYFRLASIENCTAAIDGNTAYFISNDNAGFIDGILIFNGNSINVQILRSGISGFPSQIEEVYDYRIDDSVQYGDGMKYFDLPETQNTTAEVYLLDESLYGQINGYGYAVTGYDTSYICNGGEPSVVRDSLGNWNIITKRICYNYGTVWYECYDSDDGDYYG